MQTLPNEIFKYPYSIKSYSNEFKLYSLQEISFDSLEKVMIIPTKNSKIENKHFPENINIFEAISKGKWAKLQIFNFFFFKIILPNIIATLITIAFLFTERNISNFTELCIPLETFYFILNIVKYSLTSLLYYFSFGYFIMFPCLLKALTEKTQNNYKYIIFIIGNFINLFMTSLKSFKMFEIGILLKIDIDIYMINFLILMMIFMFILWKYDLKFQYYKSYIFITTCLFSLLSTDYYVMKGYVIFEFYKFFIKQTLGKFWFQIFIFIYFQIYGRILRYLFISFFKSIDNSDGLTDSILLFLKNYLSSALASSLIIPLVIDGSYVSNIFGLFNFALQLAIFYEENIISSNLKKILIFFGCLKRNNFKIKIDPVEAKVNAIVSGSTLEIACLLILRMAVIIGYRRFLTKIHAYTELHLVENCYLLINESIEFYPENLLILIGLVYMVFTCALFKFKDQIAFQKYIWKLESFNFFQKTFYLFMLHHIADIHLQFYFSLFISSKNEV